MNTIAKALAGFVVSSALNITSEAMLELLDLSPRLRRLFLAKNYRREVERVQRETERMPGWSVFASGPAINKCVDPLCDICKARRVEIN